MKNSLKFVLVSGMAIMLSACIFSEEDRIKDHRMKCEMYGFLPGTDQFARCVQKREGRYLEGVQEDRKLSDEQERTRIMRERMEEKRYNRHHRDQHGRYPGYREETTTTRYESRREKRGKIETTRRQEAAASADRQRSDEARRAQEESKRRDDENKRRAEESKRQQQEAEKQRQQEENKKRQDEEEKRRQEAAKTYDAGVGQQVVVPEETTPAGIGAQVPVTQPVPATPETAPAGVGTKAP